jgi:hypothetical protein
MSEGLNHQRDIKGSLRTAEARASHFRGLWYANQKQSDEFAWKYSGGLATYPQQVLPLAVYSQEVSRTYFCYAGADASNRLENTVSYFDHASGRLHDPVVVLRRNTSDAHYQSTLAIAPDGHILVFCNSHGPGFELPEDDPTFGKAYILRSCRPHDITAFECVLEDIFSYSQVWPCAGGGLLWLHTRYEDLAGKSCRPLYWAISSDGMSWSEPRQLVRMGRGSYQVSWARDGRVVTVFDYHPPGGGLNARTNLYYLESPDGGETWSNATGERVELPLTDPANKALARDFASENLLVYVKDIAFDASGNPHILILTSHDCLSGPAGDPRWLMVGRLEGGHWTWLPVCRMDHNYDHGSLWIRDDGVWEIIAPIGPGAQPFTTGGEIQRWESNDSGKTWACAAVLTPDAPRQHTYVRKPLHGHPEFWCLWADGNALEPSDVSLYFADKGGKVTRMRSEMG